MSHGRLGGLAAFVLLESSYHIQTVCSFKASRKKDFVQHHQIIYEWLESPVGHALQSHLGLGSWEFLQRVNERAFGALFSHEILFIFLSKVEQGFLHKAPTGDDDTKDSNSINDSSSSFKDA